MARWAWWIGLSTRTRRWVTRRPDGPPRRRDVHHAELDVAHRLLDGSPTLLRRSGGATIRSIEEEAAMKRQSIMTMNSILAKRSGRRSATPLQRIAADPRTWILASALATAGRRALGRRPTRFDLRHRIVPMHRRPRGLGP